MEVIADVLAEGSDILVREVFGGAEVGSVGFLAETTEEPSEVAGLDGLSECNAQSFAQQCFANHVLPFCCHCAAVFERQASPLSAYNTQMFSFRGS